MNTYAHKPKSRYAAFAVSTPDPLAFLFQRHRHNPFVRFFRAAFFFDDEEPTPLVRDRVQHNVVKRVHRGTDPARRKQW